MRQSINAEDLLKQTSKHLEIRNNRYVMVDNLSSIEKRDTQSNDLSSNLEVAEVK